MSFILGMCVVFMGKTFTVVTVNPNDVKWPTVEIAKPIDVGGHTLIIRQFVRKKDLKACND